MQKMTRKPIHPGKIIREDYLIPLSLTVTALAAALHVPRKRLSKIINEKGAVTPDMALRLSCAFDTSPDFWMNLQKNYDIWQAEHTSTAWREVRPFSGQLLHAV
jgi:addiction module HigA family antidote